MREPRGTHGARSANERGMALVLISLFALATLLMLAATAGLLVGSSERAGDAQLPRLEPGALRRRVGHLRGAADHQRPGRGQLPERRRDPVAGDDLRHAGQALRPARRLQLLRERRSPTATDPTNAGRLVANAYGPEGVQTRWSRPWCARTSRPPRRARSTWLRTPRPTRPSAATPSPSTATTTTTPAARDRPRPSPASRRATTATRRRRSAASPRAQKDNVTGLGFSAGPPVVPSVSTSPAAPTARRS